MSDNDRELDLHATMALTERLLGGSGGVSADKETEPDKSGTLGQNLRYWMWRAGGRKRNVKDAAHVSRLLDHYEIELERLHETHGRALAEQKQAHDRMVHEIEAAHQRSAAGLRAEFMAEAEAEMGRMRDEVERKRQRVEQLEKLVDDFQRVYQAELRKARQAGRDETQLDLDTALARVSQLEGDLAYAQQVHADALRDRLNEAAEQAELAMAEAATRFAATEADLRAELDNTRQQAEAELVRLRDDLQAEAALRLESLTQRLDQADTEKQEALHGAARTHQAELAALRVRHAEELAETRTAGEWSLSDARRQIADLKLRLTEQEESHAEEVDGLRQQHKLELAQWLERFEQAQAHQEIRHAGEYAGVHHVLAAELEETKAKLEALHLELVGERAARKDKEDEVSALLGELALSQGQVTDLEAELAAQRKAQTKREAEQEDLRHQAEQSRVEAQAQRAKAQEAQAVQAASESLLDGLRQELDLARQQIDSLSALRSQAEQAEQERQAQMRLQAQWRQELEAARDAARMAGEVAERLKAEMAEERRKAASSAESVTPQDADLARQAEEQRLELARLRLESSRRIADLERQLQQARKEAATLSASSAPMTLPSEPPPRPDMDWQARAEALLQRAERAEAEAHLAANKVEVLKDALAVAKARPGTTAALNAAIDTRFRDAKRAFARAFHPDQGGRDNPDKSALFMEFWPILEKIGKEDE